MTSGTEFDLVVIGGGPGGYVAAIRAAQLGMRTAVIEREHLGGICLNWGCIPTKALLRTSELYRQIKEAEAFGLRVDGLGFDFGRLIQRSRNVADKLSRGVAFLMKKNKIAVFDATGRLEGPGRVALTTKDGTILPSVTAKHIVIATGARARSLPGLEPDGLRIWTYKEAMVPPRLPQSLLVIGSGAIGIEFASFYRALGVEVTVVEVQDRILPVEDEEISKLAHMAFTKQGIAIHTGTAVENLHPTDAGGVSARLRSADGNTTDVAAERVILAVGITGNVEGLGLEQSGVTVDRGHIVIDEWCRTGAPGIYAIGDVVGPPWLAHKAMHEGVLCVEKIAGIEGVHPLDPRNVPGCTYCTPQIASLGLTEAAAREAGYELKVGRYPYSANGKAIALGETDGLIKTIFDAKTGALLGAHMIGAEVTELIQGFAIGKTLETTEAELMTTIFPHPTLSEMMHESVLDAFGRALHI
ncbi:dihydrolipoamide dehydrogenase [Methyloceanibacter stevinii]|uniref:Dihydrolipoyl dehydrogenase n=1 Tax=Methyloceanibacter stevinii TaxID=1774970 RepID=A0A1E3VLI0_9HYPH|nr:dihydrolipoyl dehydrogenase [Methyloceanibacter stevinii]ODR94390.1 dihydrolipoamide dehydrogenase [Methyloceanibacter stevinii]